MIIIGINLSHDSSICVIKDGVIIDYQMAERLSHYKHDDNYHFMITEIFKKYADIVDQVFVSWFHQNFQHVKTYLIKTIKTYCKDNCNFKIYENDDHHLYHASNAFYNSPFEESAILVIDGGGKRNEVLGRQTESIFHFGKNTKKRFLERLTPHDVHGSCGFAELWENTCYHYGHSGFDAGKLMGASAYGENKSEYPRAYIGLNANPNFIKKLSDMSIYDASYRLQHDSFEVVCQWVDKTITLTNQKNICCSGGYFMNVVNNYKLIKKYPNINFYFDPICTDDGTAIGIAKYFWYDQYPDAKRYELESLYLGSNPNYYDVDGQRYTTPQEVAKLIAERNVVALYQGQSEAGPRALGNRSFLYDPRDPKGRDHVNTVKKRENYRPFAGSVLEEHAHDWFEMLHLESSPFMSYAIPCKKDKQELVPALQHEDGTSRIQTVNREQNEHYYDLIQEFYELTSVPMVLNTSFNLAGDTMVDNFDDAIRTCRDGGIRYLYLPEKQMLVDFGEQNGSQCPDSDS